MVVLLLWSAPAMARPVPALTGPVVDEAQVLGATERRTLEQRFGAYQEDTGRQIAVLTIDSLEGDPLEEFSIRVVDEWALGDEVRDDGLLLLLVVQEQRARIEVGYGLEGEVTDVIAHRIIHEVMRPHLRSGRYGAAAVAGADALVTVAGAPATPLAQEEEPSIWTTDYYGHPGFWYVAVGVVLCGVFAACLRWPLVGVVALFVFGRIWWPGVLVCVVALFIRWRMVKRRVQRDGFGSLLEGSPGRRGGGLRSVLWKIGGLFALFGLGRALTSRTGSGLASGLARRIGDSDDGYGGGGGGFGGGGASGG